MSRAQGTLAKASQKAGAAAAYGNTTLLAEIEARIGSLAGKLWGLTAHELAAILRCFEGG